MTKIKIKTKTKTKTKRKYELESPEGLDQPLTPPSRPDRLSGVYVPPLWPNDIARPAGNDHERYPSRIGNTLRYRNGELKAA